MKELIPDSTLTLLQPSPFGGFARLGGQVTFRHGKLASSTVQTQDVAMWRAMLRAIHVELSLMEITEDGAVMAPPPEVLPVPVDLTNRKCVFCGWHEFHQPQGRSTMIECNRCAGQCEGGAVKS